MNKGISIAIDGPVASGKGTLANALADRLGGFFMNTGGMYRAVALFCLEKNIDINNEEDVLKVLPEVSVDLEGKRIVLNGVDVSERIKQSDVANGSSVIAVYKVVRDDLSRRQQKIAQKIVDKDGIVIAEGRDTGTRVFPNAELKIFLTASLDVRARRNLERYRQKGMEMTLAEIIEETKLRDQRDTNRKIDPLPKDPEKKGYWVLDNSNQTESESINLILGELKKRNLIK